MIYTDIRQKIYYKKQFQKYLSLPQQYDENNLLNILRCFQTILQKEIEFSMEKAKKEKEEKTNLKDRKSVV
jgi:hypothetical protein